MKFWQKYLKEQGSFYFEPFKWESLNVLFGHSSQVNVEHLIGADPTGLTQFKSWHGTTDGFIAFKKPIALDDVSKIMTTLKLYPYEYVLHIDDVRIERGIKEGAIFTGNRSSLEKLMKRLDIPNELIKASADGELVEMNKTGEVITKGSIMNGGDLLDYLYNEVMEIEDPTYQKFMDELNSNKFDR